MHITLNNDLMKWIDKLRDEKSRQAFIVMMLKEMMQYTAPHDGEFHTKGQNDQIHIRNGANDAPKQD